jgi:mitochondrial fission protein ELM1
MSSVWGIVDDRTGHTGQVLGVVTKLGTPYLIKNMRYNRLAALPNALLGAGLKHIDASLSAPIAPPWPKLVVAAGRRLVPVLNYIKAQSPTTRIVYLMWPGGSHQFDLLAVPEHDVVAPATNLITTTAPLHSVTSEMLATARAVWEPQFVHLPKPWVAVCLGGPTKHTSYHYRDWEAMLKRAEALAGEGGSLLITSSRRTPEEALNIMKRLSARPSLMYSYEAGKDNPYFGFLACVDAIVVSGDSLSMCAEAASSGKPLYIFAPESVTPEKHKRLHRALFQKELALPLSQDSRLPYFTPAHATDDVGYVANEIQRRFPEIFA